ncbi:MAG TPA: ankyrin repeat domain-containing protein [Tepidisphaeraceae bacterium]|nr:ankyrin repeat domain-containing protein [Tepidisphaeraceae bacterium]
MGGSTRALLICLILLLGTSAHAGPTTAPAFAQRFAFPAGGNHVTIPLIRAGNYLVVPCSIDGQEAGLFVVDTGATAMVIDTAVADRLRMKKLGVIQARVIGGAGKIPATLYEAGSVSVGGVDAGPRILGTVPLDNLKPFVGDQLAGLIGLDMLGQGPIQIDFLERTLTFYKTLPPEAVAKAAPIQVKRRSGLVYVWAGVEGRAGWWFLDTGKNSNIEAYAPFVGMYPHMLVGKHTLSDSGFGIGGVEEKRSMAFRKFEFAGRTGDIFGSYHKEVTRSNQHRAAMSAGEMGAGVFAGAKLFLDVPGERGWVEWREMQSDEAYLTRIEAECKVDPTGRTPLIRALLSSRDELAKKLIENGADVSATARGGLCPILCTGNPDLLKLLIAKGADVNARRTFKGNTAIVEAAEAGNVAAIRVLAGAGANVNYANTLGETPLARASEANHPDAVRALIELKADVNKPSTEGFTPLMIAIRMGNEESVKVLLDAKPDLRAANKSGLTALMAAAGSAKEEIVRSVLDAGADPNYATGPRITPLMIAAINGMDASARVLLDAGADPAARDARGKTAFDYALDEGAIDVINVLQFHKRRAEK